MGDGFTVRPTGVYPAADTMDYVAELIAAAACAVTQAGAGLTAAPTGATLTYIVQDLADAWNAVGRQLVEGTRQLGSLLVSTANCYLSVDDETSYRFWPVLHHA